MHSQRHSPPTSRPLQSVERQPCPRVRWWLAPIVVGALFPPTAVPQTNRAPKSSQEFLRRLVVAAIERTPHSVRYVSAYVRIPYPGADVPADRGVCTDENIRSYRGGRRSAKRSPRRYGKAVPAAKSPGEAVAALESDPTATSVAEGATFTVDIVLSGAQNVHSVPLQITYDNHGLQLLNISNGNFLSLGEQIVALVHRENSSNGVVEITASRAPESEGVSGHGVVTTLTLQAKAAGRFPMKITKAAVVQPGQQLTAVSDSETAGFVQ
jgi:hypothetical protein